jgi:Uma2 family endonuclease
MAATVSRLDPIDPHPAQAYTAGMMLAERLDSRDDEPAVDNFVHMRATWSDYEQVLRMRGERRRPRLAYEDGVLELMSPSNEHESITARIGRLVEVWCDEHTIEFNPVGSWTLKNKRKRGGVEPDECYVFGDNPRKPRPDLVIEVIWTSGGIDKRDLYHRFGVPEIWFWRQGQISVDSYRAQGYHESKRSRLLPDIDLVELLSFLDQLPTSKAMRAYRAAIRSRKSR